jgi:hypothetical protein
MDPACFARLNITSVLKEGRSAMPVAFFNRLCPITEQRQALCSLCPQALSEKRKHKGKKERRKDGTKAVQG